MMHLSFALLLPPPLLHTHLAHCCNNNAHELAAVLLRLVWAAASFAFGGCPSVSPPLPILRVLHFWFPRSRTRHSTHVDASSESAREREREREMKRLNRDSHSEAHIVQFCGCFLSPASQFIFAVIERVHGGKNSETRKYRHSSSLDRHFQASSKCICKTPFVSSYLARPFFLPTYLPIYSDRLRKLVN